MPAMRRKETGRPQRNATFCFTTKYPVGTRRAAPDDCPKTDGVRADRRRRTRAVRRPPSRGGRRQGVWAVAPTETWKEASVALNPISAPRGSEARTRRAHSAVPLSSSHHCTGGAHLHPAVLCSPFPRVDVEPRASLGVRGLLGSALKHELHVRLK